MTDFIIKKLPYDLSSNAGLALVGKYLKSIKLGVLVDAQFPVRSAMDDHPLTCTLETDMDEVRRMMLNNHARYMPVMDSRMLMGVISFYDVAKAVVDSQNFENKMLKAYIRDWPDGSEKDSKEAPSL